MFLIFNLCRADIFPLDDIGMIKGICKIYDIKYPISRDRLIEIGKVHKIKSKNSYIACNHSECNSEKSTSFLICKDCDFVIELEKNNFSSYFSKLGKEFNFKPSDHNLEIYGSCNSCNN